MHLFTLVLRQGSVSDLITDRVSREKGYVVITMRRYPRFINRSLRDEYLSCMSPDWPLFEDWISAKRRYQNHDGAFGRVRFEERFDVNDAGLEQIRRLSQMAADRDVFLICQCPTGRRCHREFLLILARRLFGAKAEEPANDYPKFEARLPEFRKRLRQLGKSLVLSLSEERTPPKKSASKPLRLRKAHQKQPRARAVRHREPVR